MTCTDDFDDMMRYILVWLIKIRNYVYVSQMRSGQLPMPRRPDPRRHGRRQEPLRRQAHLRGEEQVAQCHIGADRSNVKPRTTSAWPTA